MTTPVYHEHRDNGLSIRDSFQFPITMSNRWYNAPRGWQQNITGTFIDHVRIGINVSGYDHLSGALVLAIDNDVHHILLNKQQAKALVSILQRYIKTGNASKDT